MPYAIGTAFIVKRNQVFFNKHSAISAREELNRLRLAVSKLILFYQNHANSKHAILHSYIAVLNDDSLIKRIEKLIIDGFTAESALEKAFKDLPFPDLQDIKNSLIHYLANGDFDEIRHTDGRRILIFQTLLPSDVLRINKNQIIGIVSETGSDTDHSAILAKAMDIPAVFSVANATKTIHNGDSLIIDSLKNRVFLKPDNKLIEEYEEKQKEQLNKKKRLNCYRDRKTVTKSGAVKRVLGNIGKPEEAASVIQNGGEGIGLFRTEFLYMGKDCAPTEEEQYTAYSAAAIAANGKEVIIRTLDIGGDKSLPYLPCEAEGNTLFGNRGIRYCLKNEALFRTQIRAVLSAAVYGNIKMMLPFITTVDEVKTAKAIIEECIEELKHEKKNCRHIEVGIMIETPSAVMISDLLAKEADFFSIGTNDLTGFIMAADRGNMKDNDYYNVFRPAVLRAIKMTIQNAKKAGISVGMCGEAAADLTLIPKLIEWGLDSFSVTPSSIPATRKCISECE